MAQSFDHIRNTSIKTMIRTLSRQWLYHWLAIVPKHHRSASLNGGRERRLKKLNHNFLEPQKAAQTSPKSHRSTSFFSPVLWIMKLLLLLQSLVRNHHYWKCPIPCSEFIASNKVESSTFIMMPENANTSITCREKLS